MVTNLRARPLSTDSQSVRGPISPLAHPGYERHAGTSRVGLGSAGCATPAGLPAQIGESAARSMASHTSLRGDFQSTVRSTTAADDWPGATWAGAARGLPRSFSTLYTSPSGAGSNGPWGGAGFATRHGAGLLGAGLLGSSDTLSSIDWRRRSLPLTQSQVSFASSSALAASAQRGPSHPFGGHVPQTHVPQTHVPQTHVPSRLAYECGKPRDGTTEFREYVFGQWNAFGKGEPAPSWRP